MDATKTRSSRQQRRAAARRRAKLAAAPSGSTRGVAAALAALGAGLAAQPGVAATFTVNTNADGAPVADANLTLREAVLAANAAAGSDTIVFAPALSGQTITLDNTQGEIAIKDSVVITGLGAAQLTVSGNDNQRIFYIYSPVPTTPITVSISGLTLRDGLSAAGDDGGAILSTNANLTITDAVLTENQSGDDGGAIAFKAFGDGDVSTVLQDSLTLTRTTISLNTAADGGGGVYFNGGSEGVDANNVETYAGVLTIDASTFDKNTTAFYGGGLQVEDAHSMTVTDSFFTANTASSQNGRGGGIFLDDANSVDVLRTEITGNVAGFDAGGLMLYNLYGPATIADGKISNNTAQGGGGGGVELYSIRLGNVTGAAVRFERMEISGNTSNGGGGGVYFYFSDDANVLIEDSTISGNTALGGGGILAGVSFGTPPLLSRSTVSDNQAYYVGGGVLVDGFYADGYTDTGAMTIVDSTISGNDGGFVGGGVYDGDLGLLDMRHSTVTDNGVLYVGGGLFVGYDAATPTVSHTILALNDAGLYGPDEYSSEGDGGTPTPVDLSWSILGDTTGASFNNLVGNQLGVDPLIGPLQPNGGPTDTHRQLPGSPAIDSGDPAVTGEPATDQRSFARKVGTIDIGAVEINPGTFELSIVPTSVTEGGGPVVVTVNRVGGQDGAVSVQLNFSNGSATNPADWNAPNAVVNFADQDTTPQSFNVPIVNDTTPEPTETFTAALANPTGGAQLGVSTSGTVTILDNDNLPVIDVPALDDAGKALLVGLMAAAAVVFLRRRKGLGTALVFTIALTAGAAEAGEKPRAAAVSHPAAAGTRVHAASGATGAWRDHLSSRRQETVRVAAIDATSVTLRRADGSLLKVELSRVKKAGTGEHDRSLLKVNAKARVKVVQGANGEILKVKLKPERPVSKHRS